VRPASVTPKAPIETAHLKTGVSKRWERLQSACPLRARGLAARLASVTLEQARAELGVSSRASSDEVRRAFKKLALVHHPDRAGASAAPRFRRILLAYEILSGQRAPSLAQRSVSPPRAASTGPDKRPPWELPFVEALPLEFADGEPLHYPTPEEIRNLSVADTHPGRMMNRLALIFIGLLVLWGILAELDPTLRQPAPEDPVRDALRKSMGRPW